MTALLALLLCPAALADADTDAATDLSDPPPTGETAADEDEKDGCGCALANPTSVISLALGGALLVGIRRQRSA